MDTFKIIPEQFFNLLTGKNRELYLESIFEIFKVYEQGSILGIDKSITQQVLIDFLDIHPELYASEVEELDESEEDTEDRSTREIANRILRRMEECEWIDIDVTNDYQEILNFRDYSITIIDALKTIGQDTIYGYEGDDSHEFRGYIYTAYSLITSDHIEYAMVLDQVYRNTIAFVREIRKLDSRLKYYIRSIVENQEIKDLIHYLVNYKVELVDQAYYRLKTSDNINKYKLAIIQKLEQYQQDPFIMETIAREYLPKSNHNLDFAKMKVNKKIDDIIDIYNALETIIDEIDRKNKVYVNTTISKIKFLLNDDENVIGKLTTILKYTASKIKENKPDQALKTISPLFNLSTRQQLHASSLYTPRGAYSRSTVQFLVENEMTPSNELQEAFYKEFETNYSEDVIKKYIHRLFEQKPIIKASELLSSELSEETILRILYILVYASEEMNYYIIPLNQPIENNQFEMEDFEIVRGQQYDLR